MRDDKAYSAEQAQNTSEPLGENVSSAETAEKDDATCDNSNQLPPNVEEIKGGRWWLPYVITFAVLAVLTVLAGWALGAFNKADVQDVVRHWCDAFFIVGMLGVCFGLLVVASNGGAFDMLAYSLRRFFGLFRRDPLDRKYRTFYDYKQARSSKNRSFLYMVIVGGLYLLVGVILLIVYNNVA